MSVISFGGGQAPYRRPWPEFACVPQIFSAKTLAALEAGVNGISLAQHLRDIAAEYGGFEYMVIENMGEKSWNILGRKRNGSESTNSDDWPKTYIGSDSLEWSFLYYLMHSDVRYFLKSVGVDPTVTHSSIVWQCVEANNDWHFDKKDDRYGRVLIVQLEKDSPHTVFDFTEKDADLCASGDRVPEYVCGRHGSVGEGVYFSNVTCHRAPIASEHDFAKTPRIIFLSRSDAEPRTPEDEFKRAKVFKP
jgi:hypothetical protein